MKYRNFYLFDYRDEILQSLEGVFGIDLGNKIMITSEMKRFCNTTK
ncbi:hypothetical protein UNSWDHB_1079 [Dehalobacter sp. UNSWDHB]|nr:hypothetical protein DHBDCA_p1665 [Dehalobacter sp. DCA]AFV05676.1 hypothetical protein DCF50_p1674 [Dehalobacter sp. CF]EQB21597.1 hypothetical protein UNSWDHB_1079 [Dehalobacter sp. UNSWDHB]